MLKTLGKTSWDKINVGEVFAYHGCWIIGYKVNDDINTWIELCADFSDDFDYAFEKCGYEICDFYKLPKSVQRLWKEE